MPKLDFITIVAGLGVPGLALGLFYLLFKKLKIQIPKAYAGPIAILFILIVGAITIIALYRFPGHPTRDSGAPTSADTTITSPDKVEPIQTDPIIDPAPTPKPTADDFTVKVTGLSYDPLPQLRATVTNRSGSMQVITGCEIQINKFRKNRLTPVATILEPIDLWEIEFPTLKGTFKYDTTKPIQLPDNTPVVIDLSFYCEDGGEKYHTNEFGKYEFNLSFLTDTNLKLPFKEEISFD